MIFEFWGGILKIMNIFLTFQIFWIQRAIIQTSLQKVVNWRKVKSQANVMSKVGKNWNQTQNLVLFSNCFHLFPPPLLFHFNIIKRIFCYRKHKKPKRKSLFLLVQKKISSTTEFMNIRVVFCMNLCLRGFASANKTFQTCGDSAHESYVEM